MPTTWTTLPGLDLDTMEFLAENQNEFAGMRGTVVYTGPCE